MSLAHSHSQPVFSLERQLEVPSVEPHEIEIELAVGDHPGFHVEDVDPSFLTVYGGRQIATPGRTLQLVACEDGWRDRAIIDHFGGRAACRLQPGLLRNVLEQFWPIARQRLDEHVHLVCLLGSQIYQCDHLIPLRMGRKGYLIGAPEHYPSHGVFDPTAWFATPC